MFKSIRLNIKLLCKNAGAIFIFEALYKFLAFGAFAPLLLFLLDSTIVASGVPYIGNGTIMAYLLSPFTILFIIFALFSIALISLLDVMAIAYAMDASWHNEKISAIQMFRAGYSSAKRIINPRNWLLIIFTIVIVPLMGIESISGFLGTIKVPEFIMDYIFNDDILNILTAVVIVIIVILLIKHIFTYQYFAIEKDSFLTAAKKSATLTKKRRFKIIICLLLWDIVLFLASSSILIVFGTIIVLIIKLINPEAIAYANAMQSIVILSMGVSTFFATFSVPLNFSYLSTLYYLFKEESCEPINVYSLTKKPKFNKTLVRISILLIISMFLVGFLQTIAISNNKFIARHEIEDLPKITAHRGSSMHAPENSIPAFKNAIEEKADWIELDVHQTKDGVIVVCHDESLKRISGQDINVWDINYADLMQIDVGSWFSSDFKDLRIATLDEVIKLCKGKIKLNIEIKPTGHEPNFEKNVIDVINANDFKDECVLASLSLPSLKSVKEIDPTYRTLYILTVALGNVLNEPYADDFSLESSFITKDTVDRIHNAGRQIHAWTVNSNENVQAMVDLRVDSIITDYPLSTRKIIAEDVTTELASLFLSFFFPNQQ